LEVPRDGRWEAWRDCGEAVSKQVQRCGVGDHGLFDRDAEDQTLDVLEISRREGSAGIGPEQLEETGDGGLLTQDPEKIATVGGGLTPMYSVQESAEMEPGQIVQQLLHNLSRLVLRLAKPPIPMLPSFERQAWVPVRFDSST
jgi:hypothetical protein